LLAKVIPAVSDWHSHDYAAQGKENQMIINLIGEKNLPRGTDFYSVLMAAIDFVSGMTDNYATHLSKQFSGMGYSVY
jgi:dGTPase